jgi:hypothetical protein
MKAAPMSPARISELVVGAFEQLPSVREAVLEEVRESPSLKGEQARILEQLKAAPMKAPSAQPDTFELRQGAGPETKPTTLPSGEAPRHHYVFWPYPFQDVMKAAQGPLSVHELLSALESDTVRWPSERSNLLNTVLNPEAPPALLAFLAQAVKSGIPHEAYGPFEMFEWMEIATHVGVSLDDLRFETSPGQWVPWNKVPNGPPAALVGHSYPERYGAALELLQSDEASLAQKMQAIAAMATIGVANRTGSALVEDMTALVAAGHLPLDVSHADPVDVRAVTLLLARAYEWPEAAKLSFLLMRFGDTWFQAMEAFKGVMTGSLRDQAPYIEKLPVEWLPILAKSENPGAVAKFLSSPSPYTILNLLFLNGDSSNVVALGYNFQNLNAAAAHTPERSPMRQALVAGALMAVERGWIKPDEGRRLLQASEQVIFDAARDLDHALASLSSAPNGTDWQNLEDALEALARIDGVKKTGERFKEALERVVGEETPHAVEWR